MGGLLRIRDFTSPIVPTSLDPAEARWGFVTEQLYEGLVRLSPRMDIVPVLAEYWILSEDGRRMTFILKRGVRFHNGRELTAQDAKISFERIIKKESTAQFAQIFVQKVEGALEYRDGRAAEVSGFQAPEKYVFEIRWKNPYVSALFVLSMSFCRILPGDLLKDQGQDFFLKPVGTGPFQFSHWMRSPRLEIVGVHLDRNRQYHGRRPYLEALEFSPYFTADHFQREEVDVLPLLSDRLARSGCQVLQGGPMSTAFLMFSCQNPPFDRAAVRKAVAAAIDKNELGKAMSGADRMFRPTANFIPNGLPGFFPADDILTGNVEKARQILADFGWLVEKDFPEVALYFVGPRSDARLRFARTLEAQLNRAGIPVTTRFLASFSELRAVRQPYLVYLSWVMDFPDPENLVWSLFRGGAAINQDVSRYASAALDKLLAESETEKSFTRRIELFRKIEGLLRQDVPSVPLLSEEQRFAVQNHVRGIKIPPLGFLYVDAKDIWLEPREPRP
jgi:ABC-type transport system substrate-binding protein